MIPELLSRAAAYFRLGRHASGRTSLQAYFVHRDRKTDAGISEIMGCLNRGDYIAAADLVDAVTSLYAEKKA